MQQLFTQQIRFKDDNGKDFPDWEELKLNDVLILQNSPINMMDEEVYELITVKRRNGGMVSRGMYKGQDVLVKNQFVLKKDQAQIASHA